MADQETTTETPSDGLRIPEPQDRLDVIISRLTETTHEIKRLDHTVRDLRLSLIELTDQIEQLKERQ